MRRVIYLPRFNKDVALMQKRHSDLVLIRILLRV